MARAYAGGGGGTSSMARASSITNFTVPRFLTKSSPYLPPLTRFPLRLSSPSSSSSVKRKLQQHDLVADSKRLSSVLSKASLEDMSDSPVFSDLKEKWDGLENKSAIVLYGGGAVIAVWLSSTFVNAINRVPVLPEIMELVGAGYTGWFVYGYLLFKSGREELASDIKAVKKKIYETDD